MTGKMTPGNISANSNNAAEDKKVLRFEAAKDYTKRGWVVHPLYHPDTTTTLSGEKIEERSRGKTPVLSRWQKRGKATEDELREWFERYDYQPGLATGKISNVTVIDRDHELFWSLLISGLSLNTLQSYRIEGRGHAFFEYIDEFPSQKHHLLGLEVLNEASNVVLPPSKHREGQIYKWVEPNASIIPMPEELKARMRELFDAEKKLMTALADVRPCFKKIWNKGNPVQLHGGDGREGMAAIMLELKARGCGLTEIKILARLVYRDEYNSERTTTEFNNWKGKPWTCAKIRERLGGIISCEGCPLKEPKKKEGREKEEKKTLSIDDIKGLEDYQENGILSNFVVYHKVLKNTPTDFYVRVLLNEGKIKEEVILPRSLPLQTAPSLDFYEKGYGSLKELFNGLREIHQDYVDFKHDIYASLTALCTMASYFREVFYTFPYPDFTSPEPECGKTTAMKVMIFTSFYGTVSSTFSESVLFRKIDSCHGACGIDNIERLFAKPKDHASIIDWILSSYSRDIPCERLEKIGDNWIVRYFDGYCIKAFTHIKDFPYQFRALKSRTIPIIMQRGNPKKFYPAPEKFVEIRDKLYHARLREYEQVKNSYDELVKANILIGRMGDLYYPLLAIANLIGKELYNEVLKFARSHEYERVEYDEWNKTLIEVLYNNKLYGVKAAQDIKPLFVEALEGKQILNDTDRITTQSVTKRLLKLGFERDECKTDNKTWFTIDQNQVSAKYKEYEDILYPPQNANFSNISNFLGVEEGVEERVEEGSTPRKLKSEQSAEKIDSDKDLWIKKIGKNEKNEKNEQKGGYEEGREKLDDTASAPTSNEGYVSVKMLEDVPTFLGIDLREYKCRKGETVLLPKANAEVCIKRGVAIQIEDSGEPEHPEHPEDTEEPPEAAEEEVSRAEEPNGGARCAFRCSTCGFATDDPNVYAQHIDEHTGYVDPDAHRYENDFTEGFDGGDDE